VSQVTFRFNPAHSRWAFRLQRLWLTPLFRKAVRYGLPLFVLGMALGLYLSEQDRRDTLVSHYSAAKDAFQQRPEFMVKLMAVDGASAEVAEDIREIMALDFPVSSFDLELAEMRKRTLELDAVADADLQIKPGGILHFQITQRQPAIVWRRADGLEVLDRSGARVGPLEARADRADLPLIAGEGADKAAVEALRLLAVARPVRDRVRGLVRVGERRWNLVLDKGQVVMLPEFGAVAALERVMARAQVQDMLERRVEVIDMRNPARPTIRVAPEVMTEIQETRKAGGVSR
jgi:cell division protein FtsQ